jgi:hypothetical protein
MSTRLTAVLSGLARVPVIDSISCCGGFIFVDKSAEQIASAHRPRIRRGRLASKAS